MQYTQIFRQLGEQAKPVRFLASRLLARSGLSERLGMKIARRGYRLHFFNTSLSMSLWLYANERSEDVDLIHTLLAPGDNYVDIGANVGDLALAGATVVGDEGKVYAFEAHPRIFALMLRNIALNKRRNIHPVNAACGEDFGWARFSDSRSDDMNQIGAGGIVVPTLPACRLLPDEPIGLLKIDVEGFELFVLKGLLETLAQVKTVMLEVGDNHFAHFGYRYADIHDLLIRQGFTIFVKEPDMESGWNAMTDRDRPFPVVQNILASRDARLGERLG